MVKKSSCRAGDTGSLSGLGSSSGEGKGNPVQSSCLVNSMDRGAWRATVHGVVKSRTQLRDQNKTNNNKKAKQKRRASGSVHGVWAAKLLTEPESKAISLSVEHSRLKGAQRDGVEKENISSCEWVSPLPAGILNLAPVKESLAAYFL